MKVLLVDDDLKLRNLLRQMLKDEFTVDHAENGKEAKKKALDTHYDALILDLVLPDVNGADLCKELKDQLNDIPVIIISGKSAIADKDKAFDAGADDYLVKPFSSRELKARIKAIVRRSHPTQSLKEIRVRDLSVDLHKRIATYKDKRLSLCRKEYQLLEFLVVNRGRVISRSEILEHVWEIDANPFTNTVDVHIKRLRDKVDNAYKEKYIETVHGLGYLIE